MFGDDGTKPPMDTMGDASAVEKHGGEPQLWPGREESMRRPLEGLLVIMDRGPGRDRRSMRGAAHILAVQRVAQAVRARGTYP